MRDLTDAAATLERFSTLTGWAEAVCAAGASRVTVHQRFPSNADVERNGVTYRFRVDGGRRQPGWSSRSAGALHAAVRQSEPDIVHVNGLLFPEFLRSLRQVLPPEAALVVQDHGGFDVGAASLLKRMWLRRGIAGCDAVLVASPGQGEELRESRVVAPHVLVADVMESSTSLRPEPRDTAQHSVGMHGSPSLLWVGRLNENKDPLTVLRGFTSWLRVRPLATLTMVFHDGHLEAAVREVVNTSPVLRGRVSLVGAVAHEQLARYYSAADLFVLGSHHEGSGYAAIEALACGAVPVVTNIAPFRALTSDGAVGALWEAGNAASLQVALERVLSRDQRSERAAGVKLFETAFSWPRIGERALAIYREVISTRAARRSAAPIRRQT